MISTNKGLYQNLNLRCYHALHDYLQMLSSHFREDKEGLALAKHWMMESMILIIANAFSELDESSGTHIVIDPTRIISHVMTKFEETYKDAVRLFCIKGEMISQ